MNRIRALLTLPAGAVILLAAPAFASEGAAGAPAGLTMAHRMMMMVIQLGLVLFAAKLGNVLFEKIRLPGALGELAVGMLIGPYAQGRIGFYGFPHGLFPMPEVGGSRSRRSCTASAPSRRWCCCSTWGWKRT